MHAGVVPTMELMDSSASSNASSQDYSAVTDSPKAHSKLGAFSSSQEQVCAYSYLIRAIFLASTSTSIYHRSYVSVVDRLPKNGLMPAYSDIACFSSSAHLDWMCCLV